MSESENRTSNMMVADMNAALDEVLAETTAPAETDTAPEPVEASTEPESAPEPTPAATPFALTDDYEVEVTVDGEPVKMPWRDARSGVMRHAAFTKKTQALAEERKAFAEQVRQAEQWRTQGQQAVEAAERFKSDLLNMIRDPNKLAALYLNATGQQSPVHEQAPSSAPVWQPPPQAQQPPFDPNAFREELYAEWKSRQQAEQEAEARVTDVETFTTSLIGEHPELAIYGPDLADVIYAEAGKLGPKNVTEAKDLIRLAVEDRVSRIKAASTVSAKTAAVEKAKAASGIQRGGSPVPPEKKEYKDLKSMRDEMLAFVNAQE